MWKMFRFPQNFHEMLGRNLVFNHHADATFPCLQIMGFTIEETF